MLSRPEAEGRLRAVPLTASESLEVWGGVKRRGRELEATQVECKAG